MLPWKFKNIHRFFRQIPKSLRKNIYFVIDFQVPGKNLNEFRKSVKWLYSINFFRVKKNLHFLTAQPRASLGLSVLLAIQSGFKSISLCGVDLNNDFHFYDNTNYYFDKYGIELTRNVNKISKHLTNDENYSELTIYKVLRMLDEEVCKPQNIQISVGSKSSALFTFFPYTFTNT